MADSIGDRFWRFICEHVAPFLPVVLFVHLMVGLGLLLSVPSLDPSSGGYYIGLLASAELIVSFAGFGYLYWGCTRRYALTE